MLRNLPASAGDARDEGSIPGVGRSSGVGKWATVHRIEKSQTPLSTRVHMRVHTHAHTRVLKASIS